ncbi:uncharacterized protein H6S33_001962 [Morchella sextelata]|uniref:uncharacterized protein n=1 Tax=Morchella sextelata TaxID=1174677 RepID=UPI001D04A446|nr:uncharacterized protein H6S33_001962 [Morchella sextelata]KAH0607910.1 hypothetical protein H6S33_001962 [Morchella sextelata]
MSADKISAHPQYIPALPTMSQERFEISAQTSKIPEFTSLHGPNNHAHSPEIHHRFPGTNHSMNSLPTITTQGCPHEHNVHPISSQVTSIGRMGMVGEQFGAYGPLASIHVHQRSTSLVIPTNSIRRKRNNGDLKETFRIPFMFVEGSGGGSLRDIPDRPATPEPRRARSFLLKRTESVVFSEAKGASWSDAQARLYPWAAESPTTPKTPEMRRATSTASMDPLEFIKWTDERKEGTKRVRAKQIAEHKAEMRAAGIVFEDPALCEDEEILSPSKRVRLSIDNQAMSNDVDIVDEPMEDDDDDDNLDDYNLELQCSSSDSDVDLPDPCSYQWAKATDADGAEESLGLVNYEGDDEEDELIEEEEENSSEEEGLNVAAGLNVSGGSESFNADVKAIDDGSNALAALTLTDPLTLDPRSINNNVFSAANDAWLLKMVPLFQEKHEGMEAWVEIQKEFFMVSYSVVTIPCLQGRYVLLQNGSPLIQRSRAQQE